MDIKRDDVGQLFHTGEGREKTRGCDRNRCVIVTLPQDVGLRVRRSRLYATFSLEVHRLALGETRIWCFLSKYETENTGVILRERYSEARTVLTDTTSTIRRPYDLATGVKREIVLIGRDGFQYNLIIICFHSFAARWF
jgi:hypothetical protein